MWKMQVWSILYIQWLYQTKQEETVLLSFPCPSFIILSGYHILGYQKGQQMNRGWYASMLIYAQELQATVPHPLEMVLLSTPSLSLKAWFWQRRKGILSHRPVWMWWKTSAAAERTKGRSEECIFGPETVWDRYIQVLLHPTLAK